MDNFSFTNAKVENGHTENHMLKIGALLEGKWECSCRYNRENSVKKKMLENKQIW